MEDTKLQSELFQEIMKKLQSLEFQIEKIGRRKPRLEDEYIDTIEVCRMMNVCRKTLERYRDLNMIPCVKIKRRVYYRFSDLEDFMKQHAENKGVL